MGSKIIYEIKNLTHSYGKGPQTLDIDYLKMRGQRHRLSRPQEAANPLF